MSAPMFHTAAALMETELREKFAGMTDAEDMLRVAFKNAWNHWMFTDEQDQFKGAVGAVLVTLKSGPEFERVNEALRVLQKGSALLNALQAGVPINWDALEAPPKDAVPVIPLNKLWCDVKFGRAA